MNFLIPPVKFTMQSRFKYGRVLTCHVSQHHILPNHDE